MLEQIEAMFLVVAIAVSAMCAHTSARGEERHVAPVSGVERLALQRGHSATAVVHNRAGSEI